MNKISDFLYWMSGRKNAEINQEKLEVLKKDSVAQNTSWERLKKGWYNFIAHNLIVSDTCLKYQISKQSLLFSALLIGFFGIFFRAYFFENTMTHLQLKLETLFPISVFFIILWTAVIYVLNVLKKCWKFDKMTGYCYRGKLPDIVDSQASSVVLLSNIHAIQIIPEWISAKNSYVSYEINLVLKDFSRINIIDHRNLKRIREDAEKIAWYLGVPVWDVTI